MIDWSQFDWPEFSARAGTLLVMFGLFALYREAGPDDEKW